MRISPEKLAAEAEATGFRPDLLEKVAHLLGLLDAIQSHPFLQGKLVLKGGTALNLFILDVPRLSVDIDLNYIGAEDRDTMLAERPKIEQAIHAVLSRERFNVRRIPGGHAGGKWLLRYQSASGQGGNLDVDLNFMFRIPLWPAMIIDSHKVGTWQATRIPVLDIHELASGKLVALLSRGQVRDLFDCHWILRMKNLDYKRLRIGFVVYGAMNRTDWRTISVDNVDLEVTDLIRQLIPTLSVKSDDTPVKPMEYGNRLVKECRDGLSSVLPFSDTEHEFLNQLLEHGRIDSSLLTSDKALQKRIQSQPLLQWKALNVRRHKGLP